MPPTRTRAQNVAEYGLLIAGIVIVVLLGWAEFGQTIASWFVRLAAAVTTATP